MRIRMMVRETFVKKYVDKLLTDPRKGSAMARNIGIAKSSEKIRSELWIRPT